VNLELIALLAMVVTALVLSTKLNARAWRSPSRGYQRVFSVAAAGLLLFVSGLIGWDLSDSRGWWLRGARWVDGPVWWQVGFGLGFLLLAGFWARRVEQADPDRQNAT
jgi:hypothetical protein